MSTTRRPSKTINRWSKLKEQTKLATTAPEQPAISQRTLDRVTKERDELSKKLDAALKDNAKLKNTLYNINKKVMDITNPTPYFTGSEKDSSEVSEQEVIEMIDRLILVEKNESLESRLEELETRITLLNGELGKLLKLKLNLESGLKQLDSCKDLDTMRQTAKYLWLQSCELTSPSVFVYIYVRTCMEKSCQNVYNGNVVKWLLRFCSKRLKHLMILKTISCNFCTLII